MYIKTGIYRFGKQTIAYRGDYCLTCDCDTVSEQRRTFDVFHIYFIPALPLGFRRHWHCVQCNHDPHKRVSTSRTIKILGAIAFSFVATLTWLVPVDKPDDIYAMWMMRIGSSCAVIVFMAMALLHKPGSSLKERIGTTPRFAPDHCVACGEPLDENDHECPRCDVKYL